MRYSPLSRVRRYWLKYKVEITETLQRVVEVEASDLRTALLQAEESCNNGEIDLYYEDFVGRDIRPYEEN